MCHIFSPYVFCLQIKDLPQITEVLLFLEDLFQSLLRYPVFWKLQLSQLCLQVLCFCEVCLDITGECSSLIGLLEQNVELLQEVRFGKKIQNLVKWKDGCHFSSGVFATSAVLCQKRDIHSVHPDLIVLPWKTLGIAVSCGIKQLLSGFQSLRNWGQGTWNFDTPSCLLFRFSIWFVTWFWWELEALWETMHLCSLDL